MCVCVLLQQQESVTAWLDAYAMGWLWSLVDTTQRNKNQNTEITAPALLGQITLANFSQGIHQDVSWVCCVKYQTSFALSAAMHCLLAHLKCVELLHLRLRCQA